jgi:hypothetical protein
MNFSTTRSFLARRSVGIAVRYTLEATPPNAGEILLTRQVSARQDQGVTTATVVVHDLRPHPRVKSALRGVVRDLDDGRAYVRPSLF